MINIILKSKMDFAFQMIGNTPKTFLVKLQLYRLQVNTENGGN
ncbi:hypothetical protein SAMN03097699_2313 [Flavobacteriaceae bacterium MAR_2010_188]|nr:hypothetical protein SAMN03097699_2313 [Flavobacteriaceae bacterium MAR_2010_188]